MTWEKRTVFMPGTPLGLCRDRLADAMATALHAVESWEGERLGWNRPARLFTTHLADADSRAIELRVIPTRSWNCWQINPADALVRHARNLPDPPADLGRRAYADSPIAGAALLFEGWGRPADRAPTEYEQRAAELGMRVNHLAADRIESRVVYGVDINQHQFQVYRVRDEESQTYSSAELVSGAPVPGFGRVPDALNRIVHALREGRAVF